MSHELLQPIGDEARAAEPQRLHNAHDIGAFAGHRVSYESLVQLLEGRVYQSGDAVAVGQYVDFGVVD